MHLEKALVLRRRGDFRYGVEGDVPFPAPAFLAQATPGVLDENPPHRLRRCSEEMPAILPLPTAVPAQP